MYLKTKRHGSSRHVANSQAYNLILSFIALPPDRIVARSSWIVLHIFHFSAGLPGSKKIKIIFDQIFPK